MKKVMHEYKNVQVPSDAKEMVDALHERAKASNPRIRKADIWLIAVNNTSVDSINEGCK